MSNFETGLLIAFICIIWVLHEIKKILLRIENEIYEARGGDLRAWSESCKAESEAWNEMEARKRNAAQK